MKLQLRCIVLALGLCITAPIAAQPAAADWEFTIGGSGSADNEFDSGRFSLDASIGYFFTPNFEMALRQNIGFTSLGEDWMGTTRIAADYHFLLGRFVPFIGGNVGYTFDERRDADSWLAAPEVGVKFYVYEKTFLFALGEYQFLFDRVRDADNTFDDGNFLLTVGVGFSW